MTIWNVVDMPNFSSSLNLPKLTPASWEVEEVTSQTNELHLL
jgi:hypothetical protein